MTIMLKKKERRLMVNYINLFVKYVLIWLCKNIMEILVFKATFSSIYFYRIGVVMVSVLASSAVDRGFEPRSGQTKDYKIGICCFSAKHALRSKSKDWLARNQNNVFEWSDMSVRGQLFQ